MSEPRLRARLRDERGAFNGSLVLIVIMFIVGGVALIDGGSILFGRLQLQDVAEAAANEAAAEFRRSGNSSAAYKAAVAMVEERDPEATLVEDSFDASSSDESVTLTVTKTANVLFIDKIGPLEGFTHMEVTIDTPGTIL